MEFGMYAFLVIAVVCFTTAVVMYLQQKPMTGIYDDSTRLIISHLQNQFSQIRTEFEIIQVRQTTLEKKIIGAARTVNLHMQSPIEIVQKGKGKSSLIDKAGITSEVPNV